jgi:hypothetical protein
MGALPVVAGIGALVGLGVWALNRKWYSTINIYFSFAIKFNVKIILPISVDR